VQKLLAGPWQKYRKYLVRKTVIVRIVRMAYDVLCALLTFNINIRSTFY
jgi:hypothetical protein